MAFVPPLSMVLSGVLAIDQIWDVFVEMGKRGNAKMIGPFDERLSVTPHSLELSSSTYLTMLLQQFHALWDLGFYFSSNESILVDEIPVFYDVSRIVPISGMTEIEQNSAIASLQQLFPPSVAILNQTFTIPPFFKIQPFFGVSWQIFSGVLPTVPDQIPGAPFHVNNEVPEWLVPLVPNAKTELPPLLKTPDIILRANGHRDKIQKLLAQEGIETKPTLLSPFGLVLTKRTNLTVSSTYRNGLIEVQDEGSQCVALETGIRAGNTVLDYCAGAGGKSLIFAQMMHNTGTIVDHDISDRSLRELSRRAERAGASCIQVQKPIQKKLFDHVVVDAPCSGTGIWRRCPDARWKLSFNQLSRLTQTQASILDTAVPFVKDGGYLSYMTCSLTYPENKGQADAFLTRHPDFKCVKQKQFSPAQTNTDGLFIAVFQKNG